MRLSSSREVILGATTWETSGQRVLSVCTVYRVSLLCSDSNEYLVDAECWRGP